MIDCVDCFTESVYKVKTKVIAMDFSGGAEIYDGLDEKLDGLDIGILSMLMEKINFLYYSYRNKWINQVVS